MKPQSIDGREFWIGVGEHISEAFIRRMADKVKPLNESISHDLLNIAEHSNRLAAENRELWQRAMPMAELRMRYFISNWPL